MPKSEQPRRSRRASAPAAAPEEAPAARNGTAATVDLGRMLLAKILSALGGTLLGLLSAVLIGYFFISEWNERLSAYQDQQIKLEQQLEEIEPNYNQLTQKHNRAQDAVSEAALELRTTQERAQSGDAAAQQELAEKQRLADDAALQLTAVNSEWGPVRQQYERIQSNVAFLAGRPGPDGRWQKGQIDEAKANILILNLISIAAIAVLAMLGYLFYPLTYRWLNRSAETWSAIYAQTERRSQSLIIGFFAGLVLAVVVLLALFTTFNTAPLTYPIVRLLIGTFFATATGIAGSLIAANYFGPAPRRLDPYRDFRVVAKPKILDSSVLIDGRVQEVSATGFLDGPLLVTSSVLRELQSLADSSDGRKRAKGRRGLEQVNAMKDDPRIDLRFFEDATISDGARSTDEQLISVAAAMGGAVVTNDYNLNRVAAIREVQVINLNQLANAVKTRHVPGDLIEIEIIDRGKQRGQGVGYLEDGTMVVIEDGEPFIRQTRTIKLTSVTQTVQGRLIFGRVDLAEEEAADA